MSDVEKCLSLVLETGNSVNTSWSLWILMSGRPRSVCQLDFTWL